MKIVLLSLFSAVLFFLAPASLAQEQIAPSPYKPGENLVYEGKYKALGLAFSVADFEFSVAKSETEGDYFIKSVATSRGTLAKLFSFTFLQRIESVVDGDKLQILTTVKRDEQKKRIRDSEAVFDYSEKKVTYVETDPNDPSRPPKRVASTIEESTQDIVSGGYMLRRMPLAVGNQFVLKVSDSGLVYDIPVNITAREQKKTILGKIWCWKIEPEIFGEGRFIERKGTFTIWISDDPRRIPVRAKVDVSLGSVEIKLKRMSNTNEKTVEDKETEDTEDTEEN